MFNTQLQTTLDRSQHQQNTSFADGGKRVSRFFAIRAANGTYRGVHQIQDRKRGELPPWEYQVDDAERFRGNLGRKKATAIAKEIEGAIVVEVQLINGKWQEADD